MSYSTIKAYLVKRLATFSLSEAKNQLDFESDSENYDRKYTIQNPLMELDKSDTLATRFLPSRTFVISLAFKTSDTGIIAEYAATHSLIENVIRDVHSSFNYRQVGIRGCWFVSSKIQRVKDYLAVDITLNVEDSLDYVTA